MVRDKKKLVFINGGKHFWNREKDILLGFLNDFEVFLIINHSIDTNYSIDDIIYFCKQHHIKLKIIDYTTRRASNPFMMIKDFINVLDIIKFNPNIIYIESFGSPYFAIFTCLLLNSNKVIFSILDYKLHPYDKNSFKRSEKFYQFMYLKFFKNYQLFSYDQAEMMREDYPHKNINVIRLYLIGSDLPRNKNKEEGISTNINFLFFGKIFYYKGIDILIQAAEKLSKKYDNFKVTIAGKCDDFNQYEKLIKNKNIFNLKIYYLNKDEFPDLFSSADYFILPYREVTQSGPLMLGFNYQILPIASNLRGFSEHIEDGKNGFLFTPDSVNALEAVMEKAINLNDHKKNEMTVELKKYINNEFDLLKVQKKYIDMFYSVIN